MKYKLPIPLLTILLLYVSCTTLSDEEPKVIENELKSLIRIHFPEYKIMDHRFINDDIQSPYTSFTDLFEEFEHSEGPFVFTYDLDQNGYEDHIVSIYKTEFYSNGRYDSTFESRSIAFFGSPSGFEVGSENISYRASLFSGTLNYKVRYKYGIINEGCYLRGYPFEDSISISRAALGIYTTLGVGITQFFSKDSTISTPIFLY